MVCASVFWLCVSQPSFPPLPIPWKLNCSLVQGSFVSVFLFLPSLPFLPLFSIAIIIYPDMEKQSLHSASLPFSMYLFMHLCVCVFGSVCLVFPLSIPFFSYFLFLLSVITNINTAGGFGQLGCFVVWYSVLSLMLKSQKHGDILMCSTALVETSLWNLHVPLNRNICINVIFSDGKVV